MALAAVDPSDFQDQWRLNEGFVAAEGKSILPHLAATGPNLIELHMALLLYCFLEVSKDTNLCICIIIYSRYMYTYKIVLTFTAFLQTQIEFISDVSYLINICLLLSKT